MVWFSCGTSVLSSNDVYSTCTVEQYEEDIHFPCILPLCYSQKKLHLNGTFSGSILILVVFEVNLITTNWYSGIHRIVYNEVVQTSKLLMRDVTVVCMHDLFHRITIRLTTFCIHPSNSRLSHHGCMSWHPISTNMEQLVAISC